MVKRKYTYPLGWAFYAEEDAQRLSNYAKEGWLLKRINKLGFYVLEKEPPQDIKYAIDFFNGKKSEYEEYLEMYDIAGWSLVADDGKGKYNIFSGPVDATPLYSDKKVMRYV